MKKKIYIPTRQLVPLISRQERAATEFTNLDDFDNPSDASLEQSCDETVETKNVLETIKTQAEKSEEKISTNEILEICNPTQAIQSQMKTPIESREGNDVRCGTTQFFLTPPMILWKKNLSWRT